MVLCGREIVKVQAKTTKAINHPSEDLDFVKMRFHVWGPLQFLQPFIINPTTQINNPKIPIDLKVLIVLQNDATLFMLFFFFLLKKNGGPYGCIIPPGRVPDRFFTVCVRGPTLTKDAYQQEPTGSGNQTLAGQAERMILTS